MSLIGRIEDYDPTRGWTKEEWDQYPLGEASVDAIELVRQGDMTTVQVLIDTLVQWGYADDLARRVALYGLDRRDYIISQELGRLLLAPVLRKKRS